MKLGTVIADPDPAARVRLRSLLEPYACVKVLRECSTGPEAAAAARELEPDLLLTEVFLPGADGFSVLESLGTARRTLAVFVTAESGSAVRAFEVGALDYLLKPVSAGRLTLALDRAMEGRRRFSTLAPAPVVAREDAEAVRFAVRTGSRTSFVPAGEIDWIEAAGNYAVLHCGGRRHMVRETMGALESRLPGDAFLRANRSAILNLRRVRELRAPSRGPRRVLMADGAAVSLTRGLREMTERMKALRG